MARRSTLNVSLPDRQRKLVDQVVRDGEYASASEVVRESLRLWEDRRQQRSAAIAALRHEIAVGFDQSERGETVDGAAALDAIDAEIFGKDTVKAASKRSRPVRGSRTR